MSRARLIFCWSLVFNCLQIGARRTQKEFRPQCTHKLVWFCLELRKNRWTNLSEAKAICRVAVSVPLGVCMWEGGPGFHQSRKPLTDASVPRNICPWVVWIRRFGLWDLINALCIGAIERIKFSFFGREVRFRGSLSSYYVLCDELCELCSPYRQVPWYSWAVELATGVWNENRQYFPDVVEKVTVSTFHCYFCSQNHLALRGFIFFSTFARPTSARSSYILVNCCFECWESRCITVKWFSLASCHRLVFLGVLFPTLSYENDRDLEKHGRLIFEARVEKQSPDIVVKNLLCHFFARPLAVGNELHMFRCHRFATRQANLKSDWFVVSPDISILVVTIFLQFCQNIFSKQGFLSRCRGKWDSQDFQGLMVFRWVNTTFSFWFLPLLRSLRLQSCPQKPTSANHIHFLHLCLRNYKRKCNLPAQCISCRQQWQ